MNVKGIVEKIFFVFALAALSGCLGTIVVKVDQDVVQHEWNRLVVVEVALDTR